MIYYYYYYYYYYYAVTCSSVVPNRVRFPAGAESAMKNLKSTRMGGGVP
jgi:hypothetical protein